MNRTERYSLPAKYGSLFIRAQCWHPPKRRMRMGRAFTKKSPMSRKKCCQTDQKLFLIEITYLGGLHDLQYLFPAMLNGVGNFMFVPRGSPLTIYSVDSTTFFVELFKRNAIVKSLFLLICEVAQSIPYGYLMSMFQSIHRRKSSISHCEELWELKVQMSSLTVLGALCTRS